MNDRIQLPFRFDVAAMQSDVQRLEQGHWIDHFVKQNYEGDWGVIPLRGPAAATHPVMMIYSDPSCTEFADTPFLQELDYLPTVLRAFDCPLQAVRLMKLTAGSRIHEHTDLDLDADLGTARLHIPVQTSDQVDFRLNGTRVNMQPGECWYLRLSDPHSVENASDRDRVHLVIDATVNDWLGSILRSADLETVSSQRKDS